MWAEVQLIVISAFCLRPSLSVRVFDTDSLDLKQPIHVFSTTVTSCITFK